MKRRLRCAVALLLPAVLIGSAAGWREAFICDRDAVLRGEVWRLLTGHWVHFSAGHLLADAAALLLGAWLVDARHTRAWLLTLSAAAGLIPVTLWIGAPDLARFGGLSGLAMATWTFAAVGLARTSRGLSVALFALITAKLLGESLTGQFALADLAGPEVVPATLAHWVGAGVGIVGACWAGWPGASIGNHAAAVSGSGEPASSRKRVPWVVSRLSAQRAGWQPALPLGQARMPRMSSPSTLVRRRLMPL